MHLADVDTGAGQPGPGSLLGGRFRLASVAARSQVATVFNALDEKSRQRVRIRITSHAPDPSLIRLAHAVFPTALATGEVGHVSWVALEWFDGAPLELPARQLDWEQVALHALDALQHLHRAAGRAHGSLGLDSLWLGLDGQIRIIDATAPDSVLAPGAVGWASPERLRGLPREPRSDLYALAALLYGLAHGAPPFGADPVDARAGHLLRRVPDSPALAPAVLEVLRTAMDKQVDQRFASAADMRTALELALDDRRSRLPVAPRPDWVARELPAPPEVDPDEEGTLEPLPSRAPRRRSSPLPTLVLVVGLGVPLSIAAWLGLMGVVAAVASGQI